MKAPKDTKEGVVLESLADAKFRIQIKGVDTPILGHLSGRMTKNHIRVLAGDRVTLEMSPDGRIGRIVRRL